MFPGPFMAGSCLSSCTRRRVVRVYLSVQRPARVVLGASGPHTETRHGLGSLGGSIAGTKFDTPEMCPTRALKARSCTILHVSGSELSRRVNVRGPDAIPRISSGHRESAPRAKRNAGPTPADQTSGGPWTTPIQNHLPPPGARWATSSHWRWQRCRWPRPSLMRPGSRLRVVDVS